MEISLMATYFLLVVRKSWTEVKHKQKDQNSSLASLFFPEEGEIHCHKYS